MWKNEQTAEMPEIKPESKSPTVNTLSGTSTIGGSTSAAGEISGNEDLVIQGDFEGTLNLPNNYIEVAHAGAARADLIAKDIKVYGSVEGNFSASERVVIKKSGRVKGNISTPRVVLEDGCIFIGRIETQRSS